jgi:hypothetical protein
MRRICLLLLCAYNFYCVHAQLTGTFSNWTDPEHHDCLFEHNPVAISNIDKAHKLVKKPSVKDLTKCIAACGKYFTFSGAYSDSAFRFIMPAYFDSQNFTLNTNSFRICFSSTDSSNTEIIVHYDFLNKERKDYYVMWANDKDGQIKKAELEGRTIFLTTNWVRKWEGILFLENNISISYRTDDKAREDDLRRSITSFKWGLE